jgi:hypothetical protein
MGNADGGIGGVDVLTASALRAVGVDAQGKTATVAAEV